MMWLSFALVIMSAFLAQTLCITQKRHYEFLESQKEVKDANLFCEELEGKLKEFDAYKKRVDVLTLRAGFKL